MVEQTQRFLSAIFGPQDIVVFRPIETWTDDGKKRSHVKFRDIRYCQLASLNGAVRHQMERAVETRANIFFGVCPRFAAKKFDKAWQIRRVNALWSDIDHTTPEEAIQRCADAKIPKPSIVVASGNGVHLYWLLHAPYRIDDVGDPLPVEQEWGEGPAGKKKFLEYIVENEERVYLRPGFPPLSDTALLVQDVVAGIAAKIGGDHTQDLSRLLRVPGTMNRKDERNGRKPQFCTIVEMDDSLRYSFAEFERFAPESPQHKEREQIAARPLPTPQPLTPSLIDKLNELVGRCAAAPKGQRSEADFVLCAAAVEHGWPQADVWAACQGIGKFAEQGEGYFHRTWGKAEGRTRLNLWEADKQRVGIATKASDGNAPRGAEKPKGDSSPLTNATVTFDEEGEPTVHPLPMADLLARIRGRTGDWPRRVGSALFVHDAHGVSWLESSESMFGWLQAETGVIEWRKAQGCVTKGEAFHELRRTSREYLAIEQLPHEPLIANHYYACHSLPPGDGKTLVALINRFNPATQADWDLLYAAILTPGWGGAGGLRPAFVVTSDNGRGVGKSTATKIIGEVWGGTVEISHNEPFDKLVTRLLSPVALAKRVARLDNVKSLKFSWAELEGLITAPEIGGKRMYVGEGTRPNTLTYFITLNGAALSTDMAQRSVIIKIRRPEHSGTWEEQTTKFVQENREAIIADVIRALRIEPNPLERFTRWGTWERHILARVAEPGEAQQVILERQAEADVEGEESSLLEEFFADQLRRLGYDVERERIFIPSAVVADWYNLAHRDRKGTTAVSRSIRQLCNEGRTRQLTENKCKSWGRGFVWVGLDARASTGTSVDLVDRLAEQKIGA